MAPVAYSYAVTPSSTPETNDGELYFWMGGRRMPAAGFPPLPADEEESERNQNVHDISKAVLGSHFFGPVDRVLLKPTSTGRPRRVLDVGTGTGSWVRDMAEAFPHATFIGIDLLPVPPPSYSSRRGGCKSLLGNPMLSSGYDEDQYDELPNVRFERGDLCRGLNYMDGEFDIVHCRYTLTLGVPHYGQAIKEMTRVLRPGGLLLLAENSIPYSFSDGNTQYHSASAELFQAVHSQLRLLGMDPEMRLKLEGVIRKSGMFSECQAMEVTLPLGEWPEDYRLRSIGRLGRETLQVGLRSLTPLLRQAGYDDGRMSWLISRIHTELDAEKPGCGRGAALLATYVWARRR